MSDIADVCWRLPLTVIGAGKASYRMALACEEIFGPDVNGVVIGPDGCRPALRSIEALPSSHPLPDQRGVDATIRLVRTLETSPGEGVLCLISGGASSLMVLPRPPISLTDKVEISRLLLASGCAIGELNCVRKHLSLVKGGGLLRIAPRPLVAFLLSDVVGDDPAVIASGPTAADETTFADAYAILERYELLRLAPVSVVELLDCGRRGELDETVKPGSSAAGRCDNRVIGSNRLALSAAADRARELGWRPIVREQPLTGDTTEAALAWLREMQSTNGSRLCFLAGGETTVRVRGRGRGGRNQEFALAMADDFSGVDGVLLSAGSDGVDGPTDAAGAFVDGTTVRRAGEAGLDPRAALAENDSYRFFAGLGDLFLVGPTGTNVMDLKIALRC